MSVLHELRRRNVFRVAAAYIAVAWLVVQVAETLFPVFEIGPATLRIVVIVAAIGFLPAVVIAWLFELTPDGLKPDEGKDRDENFSRRTRERLNQIVIASLVLAVSYFAIDKFVLSKETPATVPEEVSIAVMPFVNMSDSEDMAFFSDGVAEDILGLLAQTRGLRCIARSSSFGYRDPDMPAAVIGQQLGVQFVLTGSLRRSNDDIRVNVRLIDTQTETQVWAEIYDRSLDDVFAIQDDISRRVVGAVAPTLTASLRKAEVAETEQYVAYLRARHTYIEGRDDQDAQKVLEAKQLFELLLEDNPEYARAHAGLADVWNGLAIVGELTTDEGYTRATDAALRALELDPTNAEAWYALGDIRVEYDWDLPAAQVAYDRALSLAPRDADGLRGYAYFLRQAGLTEEAVAIYNETLSLDPFSARAYQGIFLTFVHSGRYAEAEQLLEEGRRRNPNFPLEALKAPIYADREEYEQLAAVVPQLMQINPGTFAVLHAAIARRGLGDTAAGDELILSIANAPSRADRSNLAVAFYFGKFGDFDKAFEYLNAAAADREIGLGEALSNPMLTELRETPEFWAWVERIGIKPLP